MSLGKVKAAESTGVVLVRTSCPIQANTFPYHNAATEGTHTHPITWPQASGYANNIRPEGDVPHKIWEEQTMPSERTVRDKHFVVLYTGWKF